MNGTSPWAPACLSADATLALVSNPLKARCKAQGKQWGAIYFPHYQPVDVKATTSQVQSFIDLPCSTAISLLPLRFNPGKQGAIPHFVSHSHLTRPALAACERQSLSCQCWKPLISSPLPCYLFGPLLDAEALQGCTAHLPSEPARSRCRRASSCLAFPIAGLLPAQRGSPLPSCLLLWVPQLHITLHIHAERAHPHLLVATQRCLPHWQSPASPPLLLSPSLAVLTSVLQDRYRFRSPRQYFPPIVGLPNQEQDGRTSLGQ